MVCGDTDRERPTTHIKHPSNLLASSTLAHDELQERRHQNLDFDA
jgi:hypothetical protein